MEPKRSTYSWDLAEYDSRTVSRGWALVFCMPSMIVDGVAGDGHLVLVSAARARPAPIFGGAG
ncbi:hypothetical protein [Rhodococcus sp. UNC363MFTsu5.1]|uniref:hypothetical protein n=1 Tax=Rhodococcus sp. UNC363MFTsu5.1 TaxID=1449069 RepID=UPI000AD1AEE0|nr:hypothetical protein [Rhodococcus sp. UNC363MFTsu5.1]